jgi:hypothetical protein
VLGAKSGAARMDSPPALEIVAPPTVPCESLFKASNIHESLMLMVIFGAGASYDSAQAYRPPKVRSARGSKISLADVSYDVQTWRPPLANDLFLDRHHAFGNIVQRYYRLLPILPLLREPSHGRSVEQLLESLLSEAEEYPQRRSQFASVRYYIRDLLQEVSNKWFWQTYGVTNYVTLVDQILRRHNSTEPVCLVTFNYDLLLSSALYNFQFKRQRLEDHFDSHPIFKLFQLHGSVGWARFVDFPTDLAITPQGLIEIAGSIKLSDRYTLVTSQEANADGKLLFPAIAIPVETKTASTFECPPSHLAYLGELLKSVTKILIIGWQAKEAHFMALLRSNLPALQRIMVVTGDMSAYAVLEHFKKEIGPDLVLTAICEARTGGFTDFVVNQEGDEFFKS